MAVAGVAPVLMGTAALLVLGELSGFTLDMSWDSGSVVLGDKGWPTCWVMVEVSLETG